MWLDLRLLCLPLSCFAAGLSIWACALKGGALPRLRSPLLTLHVGTLRPRANAGKRPPYAMRGPGLRLVKRG